MVGNLQVDRITKGHEECCNTSGGALRKRFKCLPNPLLSSRPTNLFVCVDHLLIVVCVCLFYKTFMFYLVLTLSCNIAFTLRHLYVDNDCSHCDVSHCGQVYAFVALNCLVSFHKG